MDELISRQAVLALPRNTTRNFFGEVVGETVDVKLIEALPTVKPKEIVRCKDCKYSEHWYRDKARCFLWVEDGIDVFEDGYCNYAERRDGE